MTFMINPPPPPPPTPDYNRGADYWFYEVAMSVIPADTKKKKTYIKWSQYQVQPVSEEQFQTWKQQDAFRDGLAIVPGKVWRGPYKGNHLIFLDLDNQKTIEEFCTREGRTVPLETIAEKFVVEQHKDDLTKAHIFFYSEIPFDKKSSDITDSKTPPDSIPAFEVKGKATHGIAYVTPSVHKNGHKYEIIGTTTPILLNAQQANGMIDHLDAICRKYRLRYLANPGTSGISYDAQNRSTYRDGRVEVSDKSERVVATTSTDSLQQPQREQEEITSYTGSASDLFKDGVVIYTGHNRHLALLRAMDKLLKVFHDDHTEEEIKKMAWDWNLEHCPDDPVPQKHFNRQWEQAKNFIALKLREQAAQQQQRTKQQTPPPPAPDIDNGNGKTESIHDDGGGDGEDEHKEEKGKTKKKSAADAGSSSGDDEERSSRAKKALELAMREAEELFLNEFSRPFAAIGMLDGHVEIHPMEENKFKNWISGLFYSLYDQFLGEDDLNKIVRILTAQAEHDSTIKRHKLDVRVRGYKEGEGDSEEDNNNDNDAGTFGELSEDFDAIYYDLTNKKWEAIKITAKGWQIDKTPPRLFRRYRGELPQIYPSRDYEPSTLTEYIHLLNLKPEYKDTQELLIKVKLVTDLWPNTTPKPILIIPSSQGTGKTTLFELNKDLIDPNSALTMSFPKDDNQLKQALAHNYISFFDNLSWLSDEQSNTLCRAVTGAGDFKRALYENDADIIYNYRRIIGLNGITNVATRSDLMERGLIILLGDIPRAQRDLLRIIRRKYLVLKPKVLGFLLDVVSEIMAEREKWKGIDEDYFGLKDVIDQNGGLPRMADWAILGEQAAAIIARKEGRPYEQGTFLKAFEENLKILNVEAIKASLVAEALISYMTDRQVRGVKAPWEGSPTMLLSDLNAHLLYNRDSIRINTNSKAWPQNPAILGREIAQIAPNLKEMGISIESTRTRTNIQYKITIQDGERK